MVKNFSVLVVLLVLVGSVIGCGPKRPSFLPKTYPTTVKVTDGGAPLEGAVVTLYPTTPLASVTVFGKTDAKGVAKIASTAASIAFDGAPAGEYVVTVDKDVPFTTPRDLVLAQGDNPEVARQKRAAVAQMLDELRIVPIVLAKQDRSPLKMSVSGKGELSVDIAEYK